MRELYLKMIGLCLIAFVCYSSMNAQSYLSTNGKAIVNEQGDTIILRGMGLGGWMVQEGYMLQTASFASPQHKIRAKIEELIGEVDTDLFYEAWLNNHVRKIDIDSLKAWGFNSIRLPMHYNLYTLPIEDEPVAGEQTWLTKGFELTDSLISWCAQNEMYVILDLHAAPGGQGQDAAISDYDDTKPSLWQSQANKDKTVALWKKLAEYYKDEKWVGGYDLLNEVNWPMTNNTPLRNLYEEIVDSIRAVDTDHIIFIEGNWFANDFTNLTPPFDNNMVYSPHKYWSFNDQASIQWVLTMRDNHNVPLYFGETGENSNTWFRDAVRLFEDEGIGWAWWPLKKIENISGPLSITKTADYQTLLNYWENGGTVPTAVFAKQTLMQLTEDLKLENCHQQPGVADALIRQPYNDTTKPYNVQDIPGVVYATDYDLGRNGVAYHDNVDANYHLSTGSFTAWNNGWQYRNDGVDIEKCEDNMNTNGFNVGWTDPGEWMKYTVNVTEDAVYDIELRLATAGNEGQFRFSSGESEITQNKYVPYTGGYQSWQTITVEDVVLTNMDKQLTFHSIGSGYNVSSFKFVQKGVLSSIETAFVSGLTLDENTIQVNINKPLLNTTNPATGDFELYVNGSLVNILAAEYDNSNPRVITISTNHNFVNGEAIKLSYIATSIKAVDNSNLNMFTLKTIRNEMPIIHQIPGKVEAEEYFFQLGTATENTSDIGGGKNASYLDKGDYLDYYIDVAATGTYELEFRTASEEATGEVEIQKVAADNSTTTLKTLSFAPTGNWQTWASTNSEINLEAGEQHIRVYISESGFNLNWFSFSGGSSVENIEGLTTLSLFPNPAATALNLHLEFEETENIVITIFDFLGREVHKEDLGEGKLFNENINVSNYAQGYYLISIQATTGNPIVKRFLKERE